MLLKIAGNIIFGINLILYRNLLELRCMTMHHGRRDGREGVCESSVIRDISNQNIMAEKI